MPDSPAPLQPIELPDLDPLDALDDFTRAFITSGTRAEFNRHSRLVLPFVNSTPYEFKIIDCDCLDLQVWYVRDDEQHGGYFYAICHEHRLQPLGRALKCARLPRSDDGSGNNVHRRRRSGYTTARWYRTRGL